jgi:beta-lactamase class A
MPKPIYTRLKAGVHERNWGSSKREGEITMITRRMMMAGAGLLALGEVAQAGPVVAQLSDELAQIERASGGRLGVAVLDTETGLQVDHRGSERFPLCSTFKVLAAGGILARVDRGADALSRRVQFSGADVVAYSPITKDHVGAPGMTLSDLCQAALNYSDNTAGNMLLKTLGGPAGLTRYVRGIGDAQTRLDRWETALNEAIPGDPRDTTTPLAMRDNLRKLLLGDALSPASRQLLETWLLNCQTSAARLKAGLPGDWRVGDKTGSGDRGSTNDVGLIWRPQRKPIIVTVYLTNTTAAPAQRDGTIASVGRLIGAAFA